MDGCMDEGGWMDAGRLRGWRMSDGRWRGGDSWDMERNDVLHICMNGCISSSYNLH